MKSVARTWACLLVAGCTGSDAGPEAQETQATPQYDGTYVITLTADGLQTGLGKIPVLHSEFAGDLVDLDGEVYEVVGTVGEGGTLQFERITGDRGTNVTATGQIIGQVAEGEFDNGKTKGTFAGSLNNASVDMLPVDDYDGGYELVFIRDGQQKAASVLVIQQGRFIFSTTNVDGETFRATGFATSDGTIVLHDAESESGFTIIAEAVIDQETGEIHGVYRIGNMIGLIKGVQAD